MLNYLLISETDFLQELTLKICTCVEKYSPSRRWHIEVIIRVLAIAGKYVKDESINNLIHLTASTPELHTYCVLKLFYSVSENLNQDGLVKFGLWCIGEHGTDLVNGKAKGPDGAPIVLQQQEVISLVEKVLNLVNVAESIKEFALNCLIKFYPIFTSAREKIKNLIDFQTTSAYLEVQQRACEYLQLLDGEWDKVRAAIVEKMPVCTAVSKEFADKPVGEKEVDDISLSIKESKGPTAGGTQQLLVSHSVDVRKETAIQDLLDLDSLDADQLDAEKTGMATTTATTTTTGGSNTPSNLFELDFGGVGGGSTSTNNTTGGSKPTNIMDLYSGGVGGQTQLGGSGFGVGMGMNFNTNPVGSGGGGGMSFGMNQQPSGNFLESINYGGGRGTSTQQQQQPTNQPSSGFDLLDNLGDFGSTQQQLSSNLGSSKTLTLPAFQDGNINVVFTCNKESEGTRNINIVFDNQTASQITDLVFQVAVQKHLKLTVNPLPGTKFYKLQRQELLRFQEKQL